MKHHLILSAPAVWPVVRIVCRRWKPARRRVWVPVRRVVKAWHR